MAYSGAGYPMGQAPPPGPPAYAPPYMTPGGGVPGPNFSMPITHPNVPYIGPTPRLQDGTMIMIQGTPTGNRFHINLSYGAALNEKVDSALHMNPRFEGANVVVRNSFSRNNWAQEERGGAPFPLKQGQPFECIILTTNQNYKIAFNGHHFCEFKHRMPKEQVTHLVIDGNVTLQSIKFQGPGTEPSPQPMPGYGPPAPGMPQPYQPPHGGVAMPGMGPPGPTGPPGPPGAGFPQGPHVPQVCPPPYQGPPAPQGPHAPHCPPGSYGAPPQPGPPQPATNLNVPLKHAIAGGLYPGRLLYISGVPNPGKPTKFAINLKVSDGPRADIAFHFNPRFNENCVVRNSFLKNAWGREERQEPNFPFTPGVQFDIIIMCEGQSLKIAVNNNHFIEYRHRVKDLNTIRWLEVTGDLRLTNVHVP